MCSHRWFGDARCYVGQVCVLSRNEGFLSIGRTGPPSDPLHISLSLSQTNHLNAPRYFIPPSACSVHLFCVFLSQQQVFLIVLGAHFLFWVTRQAAVLYSFYDIWKYSELNCYSRKTTLLCETGEKWPALKTTTFSLTSFQYTFHFYFLIFRETWDDSALRSSSYGVGARPSCCQSATIQQLSAQHNSEGGRAGCHMVHFVQSVVWQYNLDGYICKRSS